MDSLTFKEGKKDACKKNEEPLTDWVWPVKECTKLPSAAFQTHILQSAHESSPPHNQLTEKKDYISYFKKIFNRIQLSSEFHFLVRSITWGKELIELFIIYFILFFKIKGHSTKKSVETFAGPLKFKFCRPTPKSICGHVSIKRLKNLWNLSSNALSK
jgi:hypothetical protein